MALFALHGQLQAHMVDAPRGCIILPVTRFTRVGQGGVFIFLLIDVTRLTRRKPVLTEQWKAGRFVQKDKLSGISPGLRRMAVVAGAAEFRVMHVLMAP